MNKLRFVVTTVALLLIAGALNAQPAVSPPNFSVTTFGAPIPIAGTLDTVAVDRFGNLYLADKPTLPSITGPSIHRVRRSGVVDLVHAQGFGTISQMAYNPMDGNVYVCDYSPVLTVISSRVWRLEPTGGKTLIRNVPVIVDGFTIGNDGNLYLGGTGTVGPGLYLATLTGNVSAFLGSGFGANARLQSLVSGDVLIADGNEVRRWTPGSLLPVPYYQGPVIVPNGGVSVIALARTPFNQIGQGALVGVNTFSTFCLCGDGLAVTLDLIGQNETPFAAEPYTFNDRGLRAFAAGLHQDLYWVDLDEATPTGTVPAYQAIIHKIKQVPAAGWQGSLLVTSLPALVSFDLYGHVGGFTPFLLGVALVPSITPTNTAGLFVPPFGIVDLDPFAPNYLHLIDGLGLFGPPDILGILPVGGHFSLTVSIPPLPTPLPLQSQALILDPAHAPNGLFFPTNVETFTIQ